MQSIYACVPASYADDMKNRSSLFWIQIVTECGKPTGYDRLRGTEIGYKDFDLVYVKEAYTLKASH